MSDEQPARPGFIQLSAEAETVFLRQERDAQIEHANSVVKFQSNHIDIYQTHIRRVESLWWVSTAASVAMCLAVLALVAVILLRIGP